MDQNKVCFKRKHASYVAGCGMIDDKDIKKALSCLHPREREHCDRLKYDQPKKNYLLGRAAAKKAIRELLPALDGQAIFVDQGVFGFPVVKGEAVQNIQVSISHCDNKGIAMAFPEDHPLGIDLEKVDRDKKDAMMYTMTPQELKQEWERGLAYEQYCTIVWTAKEALSKIFRTGLMLDFKLAELDQLAKTGVFYTSSFKHFPQYKAVSYCSGVYVCSVVFPKNSEAEWGKFFERLDQFAGS